MRVIAAEVAISPPGMGEIEVGMFPMQLDVPCPAGTQGAYSVGPSQFEARLTLHTSRGDRTIRGYFQVWPETDDQRQLSSSELYHEILASAEGRRTARQS